MPALEIIRGFKGTLDFYYWRGVPCVRKWPHTPRAHLTQGTLDAAAVFTAIIQGYALLGGAVKALFQEAAADQPRTGRDLYVSAAYGNLHESSMSDITDLITIANEYLLTLTDLTDALQSIAADRLIVRGEDQLHSYKKPLSSRNVGVISGANGYLDSNTPDVGLVWHVTHVGARDNTSPPTALLLALSINGTFSEVANDVRAIAAQETLTSKVDLWLEPNHFIRAVFAGSLVDDQCVIDLSGEVLTKES